MTSYSPSVRVRFAPSPTGLLHVGNARTAIFNYLFARKYAGKFILRLEDTDIQRSSSESEKTILRDLKWLGISWDEGPDMGGQYGPYRQSEKLEIYRDYARKLLDSGRAYHCYCTSGELETQRRQLLAAGKPPRYSGRCRALSEQEKITLQNQGKLSTIRFRVEGGKKVLVEDGIRAEVCFDTDLIGDFVLVRSDGIAAYNFAVVIDDAQMEISHVIRGEDHLSNTPRQILLNQALGFDPPQFAHLPMILGPDHTRLSKRHGATSVSAFRQQGVLAAALVNYLALLGWSPGDNREILPVEEMIRCFSLDQVAKSAAVFDPAKLNWMNGNYIRNTGLERIVEGCLPYLQDSGFFPKTLSTEEMERASSIVATIQDSLETLADVTEQARIFFHPAPPNPEARHILEDENARIVIDCFREKLAAEEKADRDSFKTILNQVKKETAIKGKGLFMPIRVALTGQTHGPDLAAIFEILGKDESLRRAAG